MAGWQDGRMSGWQDGRMAGWQAGWNCKIIPGWKDSRLWDDTGPKFLITKFKSKFLMLHSSEYYKIPNPKISNFIYFEVS
jgi:hypothetical protein